jgi:cell division protein YceG involved in septum cleavage
MDASYNAYREIRIAANRKKRLRIVRRQRMILGIVIAVIVFLGIFLATTMLTQAQSENVPIKYYTSITIQPGDTLSSIAASYLSDSELSKAYKNADSYIKEVCAMNHIDEGETIYAGENLCVPYYSYEVKE